MKISEKGIQLIKEFEGCRLTAYKCQAGRWTIGYGHTGRWVIEGLSITQKQAEEWLIVDCNQVIKLLRAEYIGPLRQCQLDALISLGFNIGVEALRSSTLMRKLKRNTNDPTIVEEFNRWVYVKGVVSNGLVRRRAAEAKLYASR
ncbi:MAG: lysozyme [Bacteroidales bacterium]